MLRRTLFLYGLMCSLPFTVQAQHVNLLSSKALQAPQGKLDNQLFRVARAWAYGSVEASRVFGKYSALPGDMGNASAFWPGAKNGDSNGKVEGDESLNALQHLVNAGLIHSFTGERPIMGFAIGEKGEKQKKPDKRYPILVYEIRYVEMPNRKGNAVIMHHSSTSETYFSPATIKKYYPKPEGIVFNFTGETGCVQGGDYVFENGTKSCAFAFWLEDKAKD